jgi:hypothetical protein
MSLDRPIDFWSFFLFHNWLESANTLPVWSRRARCASRIVVPFMPGLGSYCLSQGFSGRTIRIVAALVSKRDHAKYAVRITVWAPGKEELVVCAVGTAILAEL